MKGKSMELALLLYLASVAENFRSGLSFFTVLFGFLGVISAILVAISSANLMDKTPGASSFDVTRQFSRISRRLVTVFFFVWAATALFAALMPSRNDVYFMAGGYVAVKAVNSEVVQTTSDKALNSIEHWLDKELQKTAAEEAAKAAKNDKSKKG